MKRHEIKDRMILETRDGDKYIIVNDILCPIEDDTYLTLEEYDNNLLYEYPFRNESDKSILDVVRVYDENSKVLWERKELAKSPINVGDVFIDVHDTENVIYVKKAYPMSDTYLILLNEDDITWEFEEDGDTIRDNYRKVFNISEKE